MAHRFGIFRRVGRIPREFFRELFQVFLRKLILLFAPRGKRQQDLREGFQIIAVVRRFCT